MMQEKVFAVMPTVQGTEEVLRTYVIHSSASNTTGIHGEGISHCCTNREAESTMLVLN